MTLGFWGKIKKPIFALAPMDDVTDVAFREIVASYATPDVFYTEFVSCEGMLHNPEALSVKLKFTSKQKPIVAQLFGASPANFRKCAEIVAALGFDGIDINMGCPDRAVVKQGAGAALIKNPIQAKKIIIETKKGAVVLGKAIPVSVKTRLVFETEPAAVVIHARTASELSKVPARWERVARAVELRDKFYGRRKVRPLIIGNGDVNNLFEATERARESGADGVMLGRAALGAPWIFRNAAAFKARGYEKRKARVVSAEARLRATVRHTRMFEKFFGNSYLNRSTSAKNFDIMKKHFSAYIRGFDGAKELRMKMMKIKSASEAKAILERI
ncbi:MAG: tRNA-dihydrouridine synthase [Candidatus Uhrbacteria bacterium GW2011_GWC2_53_7]|uniref:tRNA-dihydrouridine synthase n=1 Tax=Candidatus Uhrbacteria bacterium GW2011_GWC2_53_7 TaxID=1618986 RepID=A0A0G2API8_9BACT|nr:MAG: tRNA-dihydrouridine synthase [Candidatus Uhrbacteria bacterium GW2011_GWC2_53_7]